MTAQPELKLASIAAVAALLASCGGNNVTPPPANNPAVTRPSSQPAAPPLTPEQTQDPSQLPPGHPPLDGAASMPGGAPMGGAEIVAPPEGSGTGQTGMSWTAPQDWVSEQPSSSMRRAQYRVSGPGGDGECIVFYFGPGQGGTPESNAERWASQFSQPGGQPATAKTTTMKVGEISVLMVEVTGKYSGGMPMGGAPAKEIENGMLLGAIAEGPDANWFFKFTGPEATLSAQRGAFEQLVKSLRRGA